MEIQQVGSALSNQTRLRLISIIVKEDSVTSKQAHELYTLEFEELRRESIYKSLEVLVSAEILEKVYSEEDGGIVYQLKHEEILINLIEQHIEPVE